ncbi:hypothetical protein PHLCEN_2v7202 [Hermanssonia centrifuga]|uniref:Uncharacterized protein n=1 Tax=Hermanssonia centrifuga TaxID=98765 RepID=A0A2R6NXB5_9APHY|nr:hypothetical protein PHLCEN_2v7202 [Hermanssonia centrifuga]
MNFSHSVAPSSPESEYRPSSTTSFLSRLATFKLTTYANKPPAIDAVAAAKCGWINDGKDRLVCGICTISWVVGGTNGMNRDAASIYRVPLQTPASMAKEIKARASKLDLVMQNVHIKHPLTSAQVQALVSTIGSVRLHTAIFSSENSIAESMDSAETLPPGHLLFQEPTEAALLTAMFGWSIMLPSPTSERPRNGSTSRANSVVPYTPSTPASSRFSFATPSTGSAPPSTARPPLPSPSISSPSSLNGTVKVKADTTLLFCPLCQRRVGLWAFLPNPHGPGEPTPLPSGPSLAGESQTQPRRRLDVLKEHRSYCPYVVRSTIVPALPGSSTAPGSSYPQPYSVSNTSLAQLSVQPGAIEGWRAVMTGLLRYGAARKQRLGYSTRTESASEGSEEVSVDAGQEIDQVEAMVEGVKTGRVSSPCPAFP